MLNQVVSRALTRPVPLLLVLMVLSLGLWTVFARLVVPPVIESAYRGESWPVLNGIIRGQVTHPLSEYLEDWNRVSVTGLVSAFGFWLVVLVFSSPAFVRRFVGDATPGSLGAVRMWTCLILLLAIVWENLPSIALLPVEMREPQGLMQYFYTLPIGFDRFVASESGLRAFQWLTELILFLGVIGWRTRLVIPLGALCAFVFWGILRDYSFFWHQYLVPIYVLAVLSWTPCGDGWSVDCLRKVARGRAVPDPNRGSMVYGWSMYACWVVIALPYLAAGMSKIRGGGLLWWNATNMRRMLYQGNLDPGDFDWVPSLSLHLSQAPDLFFGLLALTAVLGELGFIMVLFSNLARVIFPVVMLLTHIGILALQKILFIDLILIQCIFFDFKRIRQAIGEKVAASRGRIQVLYDGLCPLCRRTVHLLTRLDLFSRLDFIDFRRLDLTDYNRHHTLNLTPQALEQEMYVISRGRAHHGFAGYRTLALALPACWPLVPWLFLPGVSSIGASVYGRVARRRLEHLRCDSLCASPLSVDGPDGVTVNRTNPATRGLGYALAVSGLITVLWSCWFHPIEFYPLTGMQMFKTPDTSGVITYTKVLAHRESGEITPARLEDGVGALAVNSRYSRALGSCVKPTRPKDLEVCKKFLRVTAAITNKGTRPADKITKYELQIWSWDFITNPSDPDHGNLSRRLIFEVNADVELRKTAHTDSVGGHHPQVFTRGVLLDSDIISGHALLLDTFRT